MAFNEMLQTKMPTTQYEVLCARNQMPRTSPTRNGSANRAKGRFLQPVAAAQTAEGLRYQQGYAGGPRRQPNHHERGGGGITCVEQRNDERHDGENQPRQPVTPVAHEIDFLLRLFQLLLQFPSAPFAAWRNAVCVRRNGRPRSSRFCNSALSSGRRSR